MSGGLALVTYLMYSLSDHVWRIFGPRSTGFALLAPLVLITIHRFYRRANQGTSDSPLAALFEDRAVMTSVALFALGTLAAFYIPLVEQILGEIFADVEGSALP